MPEKNTLRVTDERGVLSNLAALISSPSSLILLVRALWITSSSLEVNERSLTPLQIAVHVLQLLSTITITILLQLQ